MGTVPDDRASNGTGKEPHELRLLRQAVKKAKQFEVRKLGRKSHESTNSKSVDATKNKKVVDPLKIEAQLAAMRALHPNEVLHHICRQLGLPPPILPPSSLPPHPLSKWAIQRLRGIRCVQECIKSSKASTRPPEMKVDEGAGEAGGEDGEEDGARELESEPELETRRESENRAVGGLEERDQQQLGGGVEFSGESKGVGGGLDEGLLANPKKRSREKEHMGGVSKRRDKVWKEAPEEKVGEEVAIPKKRKKGAAAYLEKVANRKLKNRVGQRQRQKIAEVKFGWAAKHLASPPLGAVRKDKSVGGTGVRKSYANAAPRVREYPKKNYPPLAPLVATGPLHPSWAAKAAQSKQLAMPGTGVKIVFSQDDE